MQNLNRKGVSGVVASVVLIMLAITAVWIFSVALNKFLTSPSLSPQFSCVDLQFAKQVYAESACYNSSSGEVRVVVKRGLDGNYNFETLTFVIDFNGNSDSWRCGEGCINCDMVDLGNRKVYYFDVSDLGVPTGMALMADSCDSGSIGIGNC